jgi:hypothetical protein
MLSYDTFPEATRADHGFKYIEVWNRVADALERIAKALELANHGT